jgi:hypothetical protein
MKPGPSGLAWEPVDAAVPCATYQRLAARFAPDADLYMVLVHRFDEIDHMGGIHFC